MEHFRDMTETGKTLYMDGKYFQDCNFTDCVLVFCGGDYGWSDTKFVNCKLSFQGPAARALEFAKYFGLLDATTKGKPS